MRLVDPEEAVRKRLHRSDVDERFQLGSRETHGATSQYSDVNIAVESSLRWREATRTTFFVLLSRICSRAARSGRDANSHTCSFHTLNLQIKSPRTRERRVQHLLEIRSTHDQHALVATEASYLVEELVDRLSTCAAVEAVATTSDSVEFVNEDNAGSLEEG